jgi:cytochrome b561
LPLPKDNPTIQQLAAHATHWCLYAPVLMQQLIIGVDRHLRLSGAGQVFGWFELPPVLAWKTAHSPSRCSQFTAW